MKISIVIPTYNRLQSLKIVLESLAEQDYPADRFEVVVVSDGSTDGTNDFLTNFQPAYRLKPIIQENTGVAGARNTGIHAAEGGLVVFLDDDTVPVTNFLNEHEAVHARLGPDIVVLGPMLAPPAYPQSPWVSWEQSRLQEQYAAMSAGDWQPTPRQFFTANASLSRSCLLAADGFDPTFRRAEDVELAYRLEKFGLDFVFHPPAAVYHYAERSFESWLAIPYAYGCNDVAFAYQKGQSWLISTVFQEYRSRHPFVKGLVQTCIDRQAPTNLARAALKGLIGLGDWIGWIELSHLACGGLFNLLYYQGIADGLGGRQALFREIESANGTETETSASLLEAPDRLVKD